MSLDEPVARTASTRAAPPSRPQGPATTGWSVLSSVRPPTEDQTFGPAVGAAGERTFVFGGANGEGTQIYASDDGGVTWPGAWYGDYPGRFFGAGAVSGGKLWMTGGQRPPGGSMSDTWSASVDDPEHWTPVRPDTLPGWGSRQGHCLVPFNGRLYLLAGLHTPQLRGDAWVLGDDGIWAPASAGDAFTPRVHAAAGVVNGRMIIMGGMGADGLLRECAVSTDGVRWKSFPAPWTPRSNFAAVTVGDALYIVGGEGATSCDVWGTRDGRVWTELSAEGPWPMIAKHGLLAGKDRFVAVGGITAGEPGVNDEVWGFTPPAFGWVRLPDSDVTERLSSGLVWDTANAATVFNGVANTSTVVATQDCLQWDTAATDLGWTEGAALAVHGGTAYVANGKPATSQWYPEVWAWDQATGRWVRKVREAQYRARSSHMMASFNGKLWVFGGQRPWAEYLGDTWCSSDDGASWTPAAGDGFGARAWAATAVFCGKLWMFGGHRENPHTDYADMLFNADDGRGWQSRAAPWEGRAWMRAHVMGDVLFVFGGRGWDPRHPYKDVWATRDGEHWSFLGADAPWGAFQSQMSTGLDGAITVFGWEQGQMVARYVLPTLPPEPIPPPL